MSNGLVYIGHPADRKTYLKCMVCGVSDQTVTTGHKAPYETRHPEPDICIRIAKGLPLTEVILTVDQPFVRYELTEEEWRLVDDAVHAYKVRQIIMRQEEKYAADPVTSMEQTNVEDGRDQEVIQQGKHGSGKAD